MQLEFYYAVDYWVKALKLFHAKLLKNFYIICANIINENIEDELGIKNNNISHCDTFKNLLSNVKKYMLKNNIENKLFFDDNNLDTINKKSVFDFNNKITNIIENKSIEYISAFLGIIEYSYVSISNIIKIYLDNYNIEQQHYKIHELLDIKHATDFFEIAIKIINYNSTNDGNIINANNNDQLCDNRNEIREGIFDGLYWFLDMYSKLYINNK